MVANDRIVTPIDAAAGAGRRAAAGGAEPGHGARQYAMHVPTYVVSLVGKYLCFAILALAVDLVWGFGGILSLGHAAFFALGGYAMGMYLMLQIAGRGQYGAALPDFMVFLNWKELPWYWYGFAHFPFALLDGDASAGPALALRCSVGWRSAAGSRGSISQSSPRPSPTPCCSPSSATTWDSAATTG